MNIRAIALLSLFLFSGCGAFNVLRLQELTAGHWKEATLSMGDPREYPGQKIYEFDAGSVSFSILPRPIEKINLTFGPFFFPLVPNVLSTEYLFREEPFYVLHIRIISKTDSLKVQYDRLEFNTDRMEHIRAKEIAECDLSWYDLQQNIFDVSPQYYHQKSNIESGDILLRGDIVIVRYLYAFRLNQFDTIAVDVSRMLSSQPDIHIPILKMARQNKLDFITWGGH